MTHPSRRVRVARGKKQALRHHNRFGMDVVFAALHARLEMRCTDLTNQLKRLQKDLSGLQNVLERAETGESRQLTSEERQTILHRLHEAVPTKIVEVTALLEKARAAQQRAFKRQPIYAQHILQFNRERQERKQAGVQIRTAFGQTPKGQEYNQMFLECRNLPAFKAHLRQLRQAEKSRAA